MTRAAANIRNDRKDKMVSLIRVDRDPCPRCATRGDIGCRHRPGPDDEEDSGVNDVEVAA